jgi:(heptosyl)LPS beta-1,4-glucosyltransferase
MAEKGKPPSVFSALGHGMGKFVKMYLLKRGFMDGGRGLVIAVLGAYYVFLKYVKHWERNRTFPTPR